MPLFICSKCGCVENNHLVNKSEPYVPTVYNFEGEESKFFPHMSQMKMDGYDTEDIIVNGKVWKRKDENKFLCSECNTGVWHNEFKKSFPDEETKILSLFSQNGFITPYDQDQYSYFKDDNSEFGYRPNLQYYYILKLYRKMIDNENFRGSILGDLKMRSEKIKPSNETFKEFLNYRNFLLFFDLLKEEGDNFHLTLQGDIKNEDIDWSDTRDISLLLLDSVLDESKAKGLWQTLYHYHNDDINLFREKIIRYQAFKQPPNINNSKKPHWKDLQPIDAKEKKLKLAEEKRQRKLKKRSI